MQLNMEMTVCGVTFAKKLSWHFASTETEREGEILLKV